MSDSGLEKLVDKLNRDVADREARHQEVQEAVKQSRQMIHDLNQPLTTIMGNLELMLMRLGPDDQGRPKLKTLVDQCERMRQLLIQLGEVIRGQDDDVRAERQE
ncbi:MAG: hypothetical protein KJ621_10040 [Proteobacteria bacterium]|nr:hypothetical protein [Pseudomonadota bacterium]MBU1740958.1 hypothetical protein [Pseudomonadota bacterium]